GRALSQGLVETAALDHETVDDAMEYGAVVEARVHVRDEVLDSGRSLFGVEFQCDDAAVGVQFNHRIGGMCKAGEGEQGDGAEQSFHGSVPVWVQGGRPFGWRGAVL